MALVERDLAASRARARDAIRRGCVRVDEGPGARGLFLVKPHFEIGHEHVGSGGLVRDRERAEGCATDIAAWLADAQGWSVLRQMEAPVAGSGGNLECLLAARNGRPDG